MKNGRAAFILGTLYQKLVGRLRGDFSFGKNTKSLLEKGK